MAGAFALLDELVAAGMTLVHPFDDRAVLAAQGSVGSEFAADALDVTDVLVSIGGGALIAGVATAFHALRPGVRVWAVETEGADAMTRALAAGAPVPMVPTSIVSTLSAPYVSELTLAHVRALVEDVLVVPTPTPCAAPSPWRRRPRCGPSLRRVAWCRRPCACWTGSGADARLGLVVCGGNTTAADVTIWTQRFAATPYPPRLPTPAR